MINTYTYIRNIKFSGVFAISYANNSNALYKSVSIEKTTEEVAKSIEKDLGSYSDNENNQVPSNIQPEVQLVDENYKEKIISLLNMEFVQVHIFIIFW